MGYSILSQEVSLGTSSSGTFWVLYMFVCAYVCIVCVQINACSFMYNFYVYTHTHIYVLTHALCVYTCVHVCVCDVDARGQPQVSSLITFHLLLRQDLLLNLELTKWVRLADPRDLYPYIYLSLYP